MDAKTIIYITLAVGMTIGGILTAINKVRFVNKEDCEKEKADCQKQICGKIDAVKNTIDDMKTTVETNATESRLRRESDKKDLNDHLINIATFVGKVEQYMVNKKL